MKIFSLNIRQFRNITEATVTPGEGITLLYGDNGQGKTNILEAVWLFTGEKSFRGAKDIQLVQNKKQRADIALSFEEGGRKQQATIIVQNRRNAEINGIAQKKISDICGRFRAVIFSPEHLSLVKGGPAVRRRFLDAAICQLYPAAAAELIGFSRALRQRNSLLKAMRAGENRDFNLLDAFDAALAAEGETVRSRREAYLLSLGDLVRPIYASVSNHREKIELISAFGKGNFLSVLRKNRKRDIAAGSTCEGPQRDDFDIRINGVSAAGFASQGQQRSVVLAIKMAEAELLKRQYGESPVMLLDDVMSELDDGRRRFLLKSLGKTQTLITGCSREPLPGGKALKVENGNIREI